jgi:N-acetylmuramoyl-L-alanine amidase
MPRTTAVAAMFRQTIGWRRCLSRTAVRALLVGVALGVVLPVACGPSLFASAARGRVGASAHQRFASSGLVTWRSFATGVSWLVGRGGAIPFVGGACVAFAPLAHWNGRVVFLDPGHGGFDPGALTTVSGERVAEKRVTLAVGLRALVLLRRAGFRVVMSRLGDTTVARLGGADLRGRVLTARGVRRDLSARNLCADAAHASVLIGIHMNGFRDPLAAGAEAIYCDDRRFAGRSRRLARLVQQQVLSSLRRAGWRVPNRGVRDDHGTGAPAFTAEGAAYGHWLELSPAHPPWFRYPSVMPAVVVEPLFLTSPAEAGIALSQQGQSAIARGIAQAVDAYFGVGWVP